jgi:hypothetical protein
VLPGVLDGCQALLLCIAQNTDHRLNITNHRLALIEGVLLKEPTLGSMSITLITLLP